MDVDLKNTLAAKELPTNPTDTSSERTDLTAMEALKSPKDVLALGQAIADQLELANRGAILERWLAHHLAEVLDNVDRFTGSAKEEAKRKAVELILKLWKHRRELPEPVDPLGGYRKVIEVLGSLMPESNPWKRLSRAGGESECLRDAFDALAKVVVYGVYLSHLSAIRNVTSDEKRALSDEELSLKKTLDWWLPFTYSEVEASTNIDLDPNAEFDPNLPYTERRLENSEEIMVLIRAKIMEEIKNAQHSLDSLLIRWQEIGESR